MFRFEPATEDLDARLVFQSDTTRIELTPDFKQAVDLLTLWAIDEDAPQGNLLLERWNLCTEIKWDLAKVYLSFEHEASGMSVTVVKIDDSLRTALKAWKEYTKSQSAERMLQTANEPSVAEEQQNQNDQLCGSCSTSLD